MDQTITPSKNPKKILKKVLEKTSKRIAKPISNLERSERTRELILRAAEAEFVSNGLEGTKMETIAKAAGINKALVYRHFERKELLFRRVLLDAYRKMRRAEAEFKFADDPVRALEQLCEFTLDYYAAHPGFLVLVGIENLHKGDNLRNALPDELGIKSLISIVGTIIAKGQKDGRFRADLDPVDLWMALSSQCWFTVATAYTVEITFGRRVLSKPEKAHRLASIKEVVKRFALRS